MDDVGVLDPVAGKQLPDGLAGDGEAAGIQQACLVQLAHDGIDAAGTVQVVHVVMSVRTDVAEVRRGLADLVKLLQRQGQPQLVGNGGQMQGGVGGAGDGHVHADGVLKGLLGQDVLRTDMLLNHVDHTHAGALGQS